jgi:hypothetical protein
MPDYPNQSNTVRTAVFAGIAVVIVGAVVAFALFQKPPPAYQSSTSTSPTATPTPAKTGAESSGPRASQQPTGGDIAATPEPDASAMQVQIPAWENQIDQVLRSNMNETQTAQALISMLPSLPEEGQIEAANHIANLLPDENYNQARPLLLNPSMPEPVLSVFFTDLMNRADNTKLRTFLDIAKIPNHPFHEEALSDLQIYVGDDFGTDWAKWNAAVERYLKEQAAP